MCAKLVLLKEKTNVKVLDMCCLKLKNSLYIPFFQIKASININELKMYINTTQARKNFT